MFLPSFNLMVCPKPRRTGNWHGRAFITPGRASPPVTRTLPQGHAWIRRIQLSETARLAAATTVAGARMAPCAPGASAHGRCLASSARLRILQMSCHVHLQLLNAASGLTPACEQRNAVKDTGSCRMAACRARHISTLTPEALAWCARLEPTTLSRRGASRSSSRASSHLCS